jgi:hypothetical protein
LTDDGLPPLAASGLKLHDRLSRIAASLDHVAARARALPGGPARPRQLLRCAGGWCSSWCGCGRRRRRRASRRCGRG